MRLVCNLHFLVFHIGEYLIQIARMQRMLVKLYLSCMRIIFGIYNQPTRP